VVCSVVSRALLAGPVRMYSAGWWVGGRVASRRCVGKRSLTHLEHAPQAPHAVDHPHLAHKVVEVERACVVVDTHTSRMRQPPPRVLHPPTCP
jgi:hypothetical protein